ncbi:MAG: PAS domain S-box protein [Desulfobacterales bacterium]|nr:PAS domain S-box protein [Desulfobacterales bacterium]
MLGEKIVFASAGTLCVATIAIFFASFQYWYYTKKPDYTWNGWGAALSFNTFIFAIAKFVQYNTGAGELNHVVEQVQYSVFILMIHCTAGYTLSYLIINSRRFHLLVGIFHLFMVIMIWTTDLVVGRVFAYRDFIGLQQPYIEPLPGPLGAMLHVYFGIAMIGILCTWIIGLKRVGNAGGIIFGGFGFWGLCAFNDQLATFGFKSFLFFGEYGFLGFVIAVMAVTVRQYYEIDQMLASEKDRLAVTIQGIGDGFISTDTNGNVTLYNKEAERLCGWSRTRVIGKPLDQVYYILNGITRKQRKNIVPEMAANLEQIVHYDNDILIPMNGNEVRVSQTLSMIHDNYGKRMGVILIFRTV